MRRPGQPAPLDPLALPLRGEHLVEASAGTGKTWTIALLYLRLVVEAGLRVDQILVVTFTEAATRELRDRIRARLREALASFEGRRTAGDAALTRLVARVAEPDRAIARLQEALREFDRAVIATIHGTCQRTLVEASFESGTAFDAELLPDASGLLQEAVDDAWRRATAGASALFLEALGAARLGGPDDLLRRTLGGRLPLPDVRTVPQGPAPDTAAAERAYGAAFEAAWAAWAVVRGPVREILDTSEALNRQAYRRTSIVKWIADLDAFLSLETAPLDLPADFDRFTPARLATGTKKGCEPPAHPFFETCQALADAHGALAPDLARRVTLLQASLPAIVRAGLRARARERNLRTFEDLLVDLRDALEGPSGDGLARALRRRYRAALIDEFQDTDPVQYRIFERVFRGGDEGGGSALYLVGDPKQAIYGFRGADIHAYLHAARTTPQRHTLGENHRSAPGLVDGVQALFGAVPRPFLLEGIGLPRIRAAERSERETCAVDGEAIPGLRVWFAARGGALGAARGEGRPLGSTRARPRIAEIVAGEIVRILADDRTRIGDRPLRPEDLAVLVRTHAEAGFVQRALRARGVASVLASRQSVFETDEALALHRLFAALAAPGDEGLMRAALATDLYGLDGAALDRLLGDEAACTAHLEAFEGLRTTWAERGLPRMLVGLFRQQGVHARLLARTDGERRMTDLLHLGEVLGRAAAEGHDGPGDLLAWLEARLRESGETNEDHQLRLESDRDAVKVVTVHAAKGLEYPIVFVPYAWAGLPRPNGPGDQPPYRFHEEGAPPPLLLDYGSDDLAAHRLRARAEDLAERLRLLYVALTRAKHHCTFVWGAIEGAQTSPLAWLLHPPAPVPGEDPVEALAEGFQVLDDRALRGRLALLEQAGGGAIRVEDLPATGCGDYVAERPAPADLRLAPFERRIPADWRVTSFTGLVADAPVEPELPDRDAQPDEVVEAPTGPEAEGILGFPRGARAGECLHGILERLDLSAADPATIASIAAEELPRHDIPARWIPVVRDTVLRTVHVPLAEGRPDFTLSRIAPTDRIAEMGFYLPLARLTPRALREALEAAGPGAVPNEVPTRIGRLRFAPARGFLRGFMDLVLRFEGRYYLLDWKSNHLGHRPEDYGPAALARTMAASHYVLQYLIYTLALDRHLAACIPDYDYERHFGGVRYLFLRGLDPAHPARGVYADRPHLDLVEALRTRLLPTESVR